MKRNAWFLGLFVHAHMHVTLPPPVLYLLLSFYRRGRRAATNGCTNYETRPRGPDHPMQPLTGIGLQPTRRRRRPGKETRWGSSQLWAASREIGVANIETGNGITIFRRICCCAAR
jgi:hypothetical protein